MKKLSFMLLSLIIFVMGTFSVNAATPERVAQNLPTGQIEIGNWVNGKYLNAYAANIGSVANQTNVTAYSRDYTDPCQKWQIVRTTDQNKNFVYLYGTNYVLDCSSSYNVQLYSRLTGNVYDQQIKIIDESASTQFQGTYGFALTRTLTTSSPRAMMERIDIPREGGYDVTYSVPDGSNYVYWVVIG